MAVNVKAFGMASALLGGCIGLPWYLIQTSGSSSNMISHASVQTAPEINKDSQDVKKPAKKVNCEISDFSQASQWVSVLKGQDDLYSLVSCQNADVKGDDGSLFGSSWMAWFPKDVLDVTLSLKTEETFEIDVEITQEDGSTGTSVKVVFKNPKDESYVRGTLSGFSNIDSSKKSVVISIEGSRKLPREIYLLIDSSPDESEGDTAA